MRASIHGKEFEVAAEPADYWEWIREGRYDYEWQAYDQHLKAGDAFIDLGAWVGSHSLYASTIAKRVIAVEPDPVAFAILQSNLTPDIAAINKAVAEGDRIILGSGALGASTTRANFAAGGEIGPVVEGQTFETECITLRKLIADIDGPLFVKMDIEGGEESVLKDASLFSERKPTLLIELHPFWWQDQDRARDNFSRLKNLYPHSENIAGDSWVLYF